MRKILQDLVLFSLSLLLITKLTPAMTISGGIQSYLLVAALLTVAYVLIKPLLNVLTLPFVLMSLGLFSYLIGGVILFILTKLYPAVAIHGFNLHDVHLPGVMLPSVPIPQLLSYVLVSAIIELIRKIVKWLFV